MEPQFIILTIIIIFAAFVIIGLISSAVADRKLCARLRHSFGRLQKYDYTYEEFESISHYFKNTLGDDFYIDDITWNDLNMDQIFLMVNSTNSSVGRDYLYKMMRTPDMNVSALKEKDRLAAYFDTHEEERTNIMKEFSHIGYSKKLSISDYLDNLIRLKPSSSVFHYVIILMIVFSIVYMVAYDPVMGIFFLLVSVGTGIASYYKIKAGIESYFQCIRQLTAMVNAAKHISGYNYSELSEYNAKLKKSASTFSQISRNAFWLVSSKDTTGSLADIALEYLRMLTHIDLIKFNHMIKTVNTHKDDIYELMETLGYLEATISIANFRHLMPYMCTPEFTKESGLSLKNVYHLAISHPVANSISEDRPVLLTGSNASGKSTFLKSVAINSILAQTLYTCPCESYTAPFYRIYSSMALNDDLESGESYYIVEIKSLKRIVDAAAQPGPAVLCFIDEVLRGTNTIERIAASSEILSGLAKDNALCFAATHDIELTQILENHYSNYHFTEEIKDGNVVFSYELHNGKATSRNAIRLLEIIGYDSQIIKNAQNRADDFVKTSNWRKCE